MFYIKHNDDDEYFIYFDSDKYLSIYKNGKDFHTAHQVVEINYTKEKVLWDNSFMESNKTNEDGMFIPNKVVEYINECHERYIKLLAFT